VTTGYQTPDASTTTYTYDDAGNQVSTTEAKSHTTQQDYDARRRLTKTTYPKASGSNPVTTTQYAYDGPGNLTSVIDQAGKEVQVFLRWRPTN
jgi:YD repeat-containing protein